MESLEAPTPFKDDNEKLGGEDKKVKEEKKILEEQKFSIIKNDNNYRLTCSKTNDSIIFNIKLDTDIVYSYYETECYEKNLSNISQIFDLAENISEAWDLLIDNINKYEKDIFFEFNENQLILTLKFTFLKGRTKNGKIFLKKREYGLNYILNKLKKKYNLIKNNKINI